MNYNSKRLTNPLKPICKCKTAEFNTLIDIIRGTTSTKEHNKNLAFRKAVEELTSPCAVKDSLTLAEIVKVIEYNDGATVNIYVDTFNAYGNGVKPNGFFILVGNDNSVKAIASIYCDTDSKYKRNDPLNQEEIVNSLRFPLTDKDIMLIKEKLTFSGNFGTDYTNDSVFTTRLGSGTIYIYKLNGTD